MSVSQSTLPAPAPRCAAETVAPVVAERRLTRGEAQARARLLAAFDGLGFMDGDGRLVADAAVGACADLGVEPWLWFDTPLGPVAAAALRVDGAPGAWPSPGSTSSILAPLAAMGRLEFVLQALEGDGPAWRPVRFGAAEGLCVRLDLRAEDGRLLHQLALCLPDAASIKLPARPPDLSRLPSDLPLPAVLSVAGPEVPAAELRRLSLGDLVWLGEGDRFPARLRLEAELEADGAFDPASNQFHSSTALQSGAGRSGEAAMVLDVDENPEASADRAPLVLEDLPVGISFELGPWPARLADITRIAPGSVLPAHDEGGEPQVRLTVGGRTIAHGRLVALGGRYGVLVDAVER